MRQDHLTQGEQAIDRERANGRRRQTRKVMPLIGPLLDAWDGTPNDIKSDDGIANVREIIAQIDAAMEDA